MKKTLKEILGMKAEELNDEQKALVTSNWDILNDGFRETFKAFAPKSEDGEGLDEKGLKDLISKTNKADIDARIDEITKGIVDKFQTNLEAARKEAGVGSDVKKSVKENNEITRKFLRALMSNDVKTLKDIGMKAIDTTDDGSGADAGFLIPEPLALEVIRLESVGYGRARELFAYNLLTQGNTKRVTALGSTLSVFWVDEGEKKPSSQPTFSIVTLALKKLVTIVPMTEEVVEDSAVDLTTLVAQLIREAIDKEVDLQFLNGDGTVWTGIFNDTTIPTNELAANADIDDLRPEDVIALADDTPQGVSGRYLMHRTVLSKVRTLRMNADGTGDYIFNPLGGGDFGTLNGYPVELAEAAPTKASAVDAAGGNHPIMMFGDFKRGVAYGEKSEVRLKMLDQATITDTDGETILNLAEQDMIALRAVQRVGFKVTLPTAMRRLVTGD